MVKFQRLIHIISQRRSVSETQIDPLSNGPGALHSTDETMQYSLNVTAESPESCWNVSAYTILVFKINDQSVRTVKSAAINDMTESRGVGNLTETRGQGNTPSVTAQTFHLYKTVSALLAGWPN